MPTTTPTHSIQPPRAGSQPTSYDVAVAAGVSQPTVSRCFQPGSNISERTRKHVLEVAARLGYTPNVLARSLITRKSNAVGLIITRYTLNGSPEVLYAFGDALAKARKRIILLAVDDDHAVDNVLAEVLGYPLDGLISCATLNADQVQHFTSKGIPVLFFNRAPGKLGVDSVSAHHSQGAKQLTRALVQAGHKSFVCVGGPKDAPVSLERMGAFAAELKRAALKPQVMLHSDFSYQGGHDAFLKWARGAQRPDCVLCANDAIAMGVMDACRFELGWRVPEDVAVTGFDDVAEAGRPSYRLTTVRQPLQEMVNNAVELLEARISNPNLKPQSLLLEGSIVSRASAPLRG